MELNVILSNLGIVYLLIVVFNIFGLYKYMGRLVDKIQDVTTYNDNVCRLAILVVGVLPIINLSLTGYIIRQLLKKK